MEGYHIASLHKDTFGPYGFHNLNVVETFGTNSRIVFPFKRINKLRDKPVNERRLAGMVTDVYQSFPNTHVSVLSNHSHMIILEPYRPRKQSGLSTRSVITIRIANTKRTSRKRNATQALYKIQD